MDDHNKAKVVKVGLALVVIILGVWLVFSLMKYELIYQLYSVTYEKISRHTGLSPWLINGILIGVAPPFLWALLNAFSFNKRRKWIARSILAIYVAAFNLLMFFATREAYIEHDTGKSQKYCAVTLKGLKYSDTPGYDTETGAKFKECTPEFLEAYKFAHDYLVTTEVNDPYSHDIAVLVLDNNGSIDESWSQSVAAIFSSKGARTTTTFFKQRFIHEGMVGKILEGDRILVEGMAMSKYVDAIFIGRRKVTVGEDPLSRQLFDSRVYLANASMDIRVISAVDGTIIKSFSVGGSGKGFDSGSAMNQAVESLFDRLNQRATAFLK